MPLSDIAKVTITVENLGIARAGFGIPLILSADAVFVERIRFYADITAIAVDFASTTPTYKAAAAMFAQEPKPEKIAVGRLANKPTTKFTVSVKTVRNSYKYRVRFGSTTYEFTSDANATNDEIAAGIEAAIDAAPVTGFTASLSGAGGSQVVDVTANAAGNWAAAELPEVGGRETDDLEILQSHADPGVAADLDAIKLADNTWYCIINPYNSKAMALAIAAWAETAEKLFIAASIDTNNESLALGSDSTTSLMGQAKTSAYARTAIIYHPANDAFIDAAWAGKMLPKDPGSETWVLKTLAGVSAVKHTSTEETNIKAKFGNLYITIAGKNVTAYEGQVSANEKIDVVRFRDWLRARIGENVFARLASVDKIPFTDEGISVIQGEVAAMLDEGVRVGGLAADPAPKVSVPKVSAVSAADKSSRTLKNVKFSATLAGAIHHVEIAGVISV